MTLIWRKHTNGNVVASVEQQTTQAAEIARIDGQDRLTHPATNPAVRPLVDQLRNEQHRLLLEAEHGRQKRRYRVSDRRAADAEKTLEAIQQARQASSAARSVLALHRGRTKFLTASLVASVALSCGSAAGVEQLAVNKGAPKLTGYVAEIGMVGLSTMAILYYAHLSQHGWAGHGWKRTMLGVFAIVPLLGSIVANAIGAGPVGVACSVGAAAFGVFSHLVGDTSAEALRDKATQVTGDDEADLRAIATGDDLFAAPAAEPALVVTDGREPTGGHKRALTAPAEHSAVPTPQSEGEHKPVPTGEHNSNAHPAVPTAVPMDTADSVPTEVPTPVATAEPMGTAPAVPTPRPTRKPTPKTGPKGGAPKRRTRDQIRQELQVELKKHYDNGGGEPDVKPLAEAINANRRIVRELLDEMNVRPMIRKAVGQ